MKTLDLFLKTSLVVMFIAPPSFEFTIHKGTGGFGSCAMGQALDKPNIVVPFIDWISDCVAPEHRSVSGTYFDFVYDNSIWTATPMPMQDLGLDQARQDSGEDWFYGHANFLDASDPGTVAAGYISHPNCFWVGLGCGWPWSPPDYDFLGNAPAGKAHELEAANHRKGMTRGSVARMDAAGHDIWVKYLLTGQLFNVIQTSDGGILAVGVTDNAGWPDGETTAIGWNDQPTSNVNMNNPPCTWFGPDRHFERTGYLVKLSAAGEVEWCTLLNTSPYLPGAAKTGSYLIDVIERQGVDGPEYWAAGATIGYSYQPCLIKVNAAGQRTWYKEYSVDADPTLFNNDWPITDRGWVSAMAYDANTDKILLNVYGVIDGLDHAIIALIDPNTYVPEWVHNTSDVNDPLTQADQGQHLTSLKNYTTGGGFVTTGGTTRIIWPTLANFFFGNVYAGFKASTLLVHGYDMLGNLDWTTDLGEVRAYDMQSEMCPTSDGKVAISSTKWARPYRFVGTQFDFPDLPQPVKVCLNTDYVYPGQEYADPWEMCYLFNYWNTDAFVSKLDPIDGKVYWAAQWDADTDFDFFCGTETGTDPEDLAKIDLRNEECIFKITEAPDGDLLLSGTTSHNFDDMYLVKVRPDCQSNLTYEPLALNDEGRYELQANETWSTNRNIYGTIVVPNGKTLTINNNAVIRFADTEKLYWPTRIEVEGGGTLIVNGDAVLAAVEGCPDALWDGVLIKGDSEATQLTPGAQGRALLEYCTIAQSRVGTLAANVFAMGPIMSPEDPSQYSGGIIIANEVTYRNNVYDVSFSEYENFAPNIQDDPFRSNLSSFTKCHFLNGGDPLYPGPVAVDHVLLNFVRGIKFKGCNWDLDLATSPAQNYNQMGTGIHSINSTFSVIDFCISDPGPFGCSGAPSSGLSRFGNLNTAIVATTFDPSRSFYVDRTIFDMNNFGIRMDGVNDAAITRNTFQLPERLSPFHTFFNYGISANQCTGYSIQENAFTGENTDNPNKFGIIVNNSGTVPNLIYNNSFDNNLAGTLVQGTNRHPDTGEGLEMRCNDYGQNTVNQVDIALTHLTTGPHTTVARQQGRIAQLTQQDPIDPTKPAGNIFSDNCDLVPIASRDFSVQNDDSEYIQYWYHSSNTYHTQPQPDCYNWIEPTYANSSYTDKLSACPTHLDQGGPYSIVNAGIGKDGYEDASTAYDATKDNGNSEGLISFLNEPSNSSVAKRNALLSVAPKASIDALKLAFNCDPPLNDWHLTQALVGNSPLDGEVLQWTYESELDPFFTDLVEGAQTGEVNLLSVLHAEMAYYGQMKAEAMYDLGQKAWLDSSSVAHDSLMVWTTRFAPAHAKLAEAGVHSARKNFTALEALAASEELSSLEPERYVVLKLWAQAEQNGGWQLADEGTVTELQNIAQQAEKIGSAHATAWLHALGEELPPVVIVPPTITAKSRGNKTRTIKQRTSSTALELLDAYPNPTNGSQWVAYKLPEGTENALLRIHDAMGRMIFTKKLANVGGILELDNQSWSSGIYHATLAVDDLSVSSLKLVVKR